MILIGSSNWRTFEGDLGDVHNGFLPSVGRLEGTLEGTLLTLVLLIGFHPIGGH